LPVRRYTSPPGTAPGVARAAGGRHHRPRSWWINLVPVLAGDVETYGFVPRARLGYDHSATAILSIVVLFIFVENRPQRRQTGRFMVRQVNALRRAGFGR